MASEELHIVRLQDKFYQDGFYKVLIAIATISVAIGLLIAASVYLILSEPKPVTFAVNDEYRVLRDVPVDQPYLNTPDLIQWVSSVIPPAFTYDFINYTTQLKEVAQAFTSAGWKKQLDLLNNYANYNDVQNSKTFVRAAAAGAPFIVNQGVLQGKYSWWVQMPITLSYSSMNKEWNKSLVIQALVVRVPTLNNLFGVGIENILVVTKETETRA